MPTPPPRRAWGTRFDSLVDTPPTVRSRDADPDLPAEKERPGDHNHTYPRSSLSAATSTSDASPLPVKMPHDASVFVASLPSHISESELHARLAAHLSPHASIKHIKLIRDNRGAVCAFVQVESAAQATDLIAACNLTLFMDRHIRCEVARAFRTLLVSWRPPSHPSGTSTDEETAEKALRLRRCKGSRYIQVSHGAEALQTDIAQLHNYSPPQSEDPLSGHGIFFPSGVVQGDYEALKSLLEAFGPLEFITPFEPTPFPVQHGEGAFAHGGPTVGQEDGNNALSAEDAPRPPMWAAKWEHRNDAVSAITALQHVPRLFICWSHTYGRPYQQPYTPRANGEAHSRGSSGVHTPSYPPAPFHVDVHSHTSIEVNNRDGETRWTASAPRLQQLHARSPASEGSKSQEPLAFSESDFPPLLRMENDGNELGARNRSKRGAWIGRKNFVRSGAPSPPPISTSMPSISGAHDGSETTTSGVPHTPDLDSLVEPSPVTPGFPITPRTPSGNYVPTDETHKEAAFGPAGYTSFPPQHLEDGPSDGRELFVGGLDPTTWDEERVHNIFGRFGTLEEIRFVRPGAHAPPFKRAFAFIKFADQEASQRAITEEHLRAYDDRRIKVQLRETTGRRWAYRGRGRLQQGLLRADRASFDFSHDISATKQAGADHPIEVRGHVRFVSAPDAASMKIESQAEQKDVHTVSHDDVEDPLALTPVANADKADAGFIDGSEAQHVEENVVATSTPSSASDGVPDASMEAQPRSADTTVTFADVTISPTTPPRAATQPENSEQDTSAVSSTPPPSNPDASSTYAPSSEGSAPTSAGYYPTTPSWIPPYAIPSVPYGPYGYYPQQVPGQSGTETPATYPWMTSLYRNVMPFVPWFNPPPGVELAAPPVRPTGYIQRDPGGIFIPVYPPERLGQYMSTSNTTADQSQSQVQTGSAAPGNWQNLAPHPQFYPIPFPVQTVMMQQQAAQQQQQHPAAGHGWIAASSTGFASQQTAPSSAMPSYPVPNAYYQTTSSTVQPHSRQNMYGTYDPAQQHSQKHPNRRSEYGQHTHRFGPRDGRGASQRRGPGANAGDQSFSNGSIDSQFYSMKPNGALPAQISMTSSGSHGSEWNWNTQNR